MTYNQTDELFFCSDCKHHLPTRTGMDKVICEVTLEFKDRENFASCEYAERMNIDGSSNRRDC